MRKAENMKILAHRGYWGADILSNSPAALCRAMESGFGFESDIRDYMGELVISHNIADAGCQKVDEVFQWLSKFQNRCCFAINIKADGLKEQLAVLLKTYGITNYFTFDMSVPQMVEYAEVGITYFTRQSEVEPEPVMYNSAAGVWIDGFWRTDWITEDMLREHISSGKKVCLVSPELHQREHIPFWEKLKSFHLNWDYVLLCTDKPGDAADFFQDKLG